MKSEKNIVRGLIGLISLIGLIGCSADSGSDSDFKEGQGKAPQEVIIPGVASYVAGYEATDGANRANRAIKESSGYVAYGDGLQPIGIAFTRNGEDPAIGTGTAESPKSMIGNFFYSSGKWRTDLQDIQAGDYYLYGYIPYLPAITYSITDRDGANANYRTGAIMTLTNVPTVMPNDLCVVIGAKQGFDKEHDGNLVDNNGNHVFDAGDTRTDTLRMGDFKYTAKATSGGEEAKGNYVFLLFDHLYSAIRVNMKVHADYARLRTIKLDTLKLSTQVGGANSKDHNTITIKLKATDVINKNEKSITDIVYTPTGAENKNGMEFWKSENATGTTLTTEFQPFIGHFMPSGITTIVLTSVYDVYDTKGKLIRENCKATNTMELQELLTEQTVTKRGYRYTVNMTIQPTYLYMLSEPDLDNPTVVFN